MKSTKRRLLIVLTVIALSVGVAASTLQLLSTPLEAYSCTGTCSLPPGGCKCKKYNSKGQCISYENCGNNSCGVRLSNDEHWCNSGGNTAACTCVGSDCKKSGGQSCSNLGSVCTCSCEPVSCPPGVPPTKFMTKPKVTAYGVSCSSGGCDGNTYACDPVHVNAAPSCSILPASISMTREDAPKQINITATDDDYGDEVVVTRVRVVDTAGNLKSCVKVNTLGGGILENATLRIGTNNPAAISQTTGFLVDAREAHGVFENVGGQSVCSGFLEVDIIDKDSDGPSGPDSSAPASCKVAVSVTNKAPQLTNVTISDRDTLSAVRDLGATGNGDLLDNRARIFVGSPLTTQAKSRASTCNESLSLLDPIKCPGGAEAYGSTFSSRRNPLHLEFTVSDANGLNDIMQAGIWIQRTAQNADSAVIPPANPSAGTRNSFQAIYSELENIQVVPSAARWNFVSRACVGDSCGPKDLLSSSKQQFSGLAFINSLGTTVASNGNVKIGKTQWASQRTWQRAGFPDCLATTAGCTDNHVPDTAKAAATTDAADRNNYDWSISADDNHLICFPSNANVPTVVAVSSSGICPANCAACLKKEGVSAVAGNPNALTFKFGIYFNDKDSGQGMPEGDYAIFLSALDKVSVPLNNVTGKGAEGWLRFTRDGAACTGATCPSGTNVVLTYDSIAPTSSVSWSSTSDKVVANVAISDSGSGIAGVTNQFMLRQEMLDGEPLDDRHWALDSNGNPIDGKNNRVPLAPSTTYVTITGYGLVDGESIIAGACVYDKAGNMACGRNGTEYVFLAPWLKTSYGDIYSAKGGAAPFAQTLPNNTDTADNTKTLRWPFNSTTGTYLPFKEQIFTAGTGLLMTGGNAAQGSGISGGYVLSPTANAQFGFLGNTTGVNYYRTAVTPFNLFSYNPTLPGNEYERLRSSAKLNCDLMNSANANTCNIDGDLAEIGAAPVNVLAVGSASANNIVCNQTNIIFVTGTLTINGQVTKGTTGQNNGCMFVLASGANLVITDTPSDVRVAAGDGKGSPTTDRFEAAIVANAGATIQTQKGTRGTTTKSTDRLEIRGWVYSANTVPLFKRNLAPVDNRRYPSEWIIYDASLLDVFRPILGSEKTVDLICGTSTHVLCAAPQ